MNQPHNQSLQMFPSIATVCLSGTLEQKIEAIAAAGFEHIEIFENDLLAYPGSIREVGELIREHGLHVVTLQPFRDFEGLAGRDRQLAFERAELKFAQMQELGTDLLMVCSSAHPRAESGIARLAEDFHALGERAAQHGLRVAYEALAWGRHINDYRDSWEVVRRADHPAVGLVLDTFHIFSRGTDLEAIASIPGDRIFLVQTADAPRLSMDHLSWSRHYRCFPGQGELRIRAFMQQLEKTGYSGPLSHEIFNDVFRRSASLQTAVDGYRSSRYLASMLSEQQADVPPQSELHGFEFVEISTQVEHLPALRTLLQVLGFELVGTHRSMDAEHWQCGDTNIVLNSDAQFADQFLERRGTGVAALALKVDSAYACTKRADFLGIPMVDPLQVGALHQMVGMQNVDGTVWYWVDPSTSLQAFDSAFESVADSTLERTHATDTIVAQDSEEMLPAAPAIDHHTGARVTGIDHVSLSQSYPDFLSTLLSFRSMFQLSMQPAFDVFDPQGLIQSQVIGNHDLSFQLAFNASDASSTTSSRFIQRARGSGVQHIALKTNNIFACAQSLAAADVAVVPIPPNYYPDLQARFGLDQSPCEQMARLHILYDEDDQGAFFQHYTQPIDGKFYFEIVQREGYRGLGANNAWLRATAQQQLISENE